MFRSEPFFVEPDVPSFWVAFEGCDSTFMEEARTKRRSMVI